MSKLNGDRARFQRLRKAGLLRRDRARAAYAVLKTQAAALQAAAIEPSGTPRPEKPEIVVE